MVTSFMNQLSLTVPVSLFSSKSSSTSGLGASSVRPAKPGGVGVVPVNSSVISLFSFVQRKPAVTTNCSVML